MVKKNSDCSSLFFEYGTKIFALMDLILGIITLILLVNLQLSSTRLAEEIKAKNLIRKGYDPSEDLDYDAKTVLKLILASSIVLGFSLIFFVEVFLKKANICNVSWVLSTFCASLFPIVLWAFYNSGEGVPENFEDSNNDSLLDTNLDLYQMTIGNKGKMTRTEHREGGWTGWNKKGSLGLVILPRILMLILVIGYILDLKNKRKDDKIEAEMNTSVNSVNSAMTETESIDIDNEEESEKTV